MPTVITDEQAAVMREQLAAYERQKAYEAALARHQLYLALLPLVNSDHFIAIHQQLSAIRSDGPKNDSFFGVSLEAIYQGMTSMGVQVANWVEPVAPTPATPEAEATDVVASA
ncbi:hypothetical protein ACNFJ7_02265 [Sphingomonas sp. HT-1]|uniref:hypothetical protein n=1 Tax=unclassified Sphingomonas TaxID=196159 RepID=UPI000315CBF1|nr:MULTISPECIES: hypothetical protein [unclassified Sphingomonas]KTF70688.1 hypothetical protein ATB93_18720 [Sphingomonas sp. WG]